MTTKRDRMLERIEQHGRHLLAIFPHATEKDPVKLCNSLRRLESEAAAIGLRLCNGPEFATEDEPEDLCDAVLLKVNRLLGNTVKAGPKELVPVPIFLNRDPRGHALKIREKWMNEHNVALHRDWGGYGILAPDLTGD